MERTGSVESTAGGEGDPLTYRIPRTFAVEAGGLKPPGRDPNRARAELTPPEDGPPAVIALSVILGFHIHEIQLADRLF